MRWKWLLVLSLISISLVTVSADDEAGNDETVNGDVENYDDEKPDDQPVAVDNQVDTTSDHNQPSEDVVDNSEAEAAAAAVDGPSNEDTVDVENVAVGKQKGKYMNYDDYFGSAIDASDNSYNWNGKSAKPLIDCPTTPLRHH